jgi:hypothetical protein
MDLWSGGAPESNGLTKTEKGEDYSYAKLYVYRPDRQKNTRAAVVICPGGAYAGLAMNHEGHDYARWLIDNGITAVILKYRLPNKNHFIPLKDAQRALRTVRSKAEAWNWWSFTYKITMLPTTWNIGHTDASMNREGPCTARRTPYTQCHVDSTILKQTLNKSRRYVVHLVKWRSLTFWRRNYFV